eukprot:scaffold1707_cov357-Prasinococcus_capsulatus_cf.AAC.3
MTTARLNHRASYRVFRGRLFHLWLVGSRRGCHSTGNRALVTLRLSFCCCRRLLRLYTLHQGLTRRWRCDRARCCSHAGTGSEGGIAYLASTQPAQTGGKQHQIRGRGSSHERDLQRLCRGRSGLLSPGRRVHAIRVAVVQAVAAIGVGASGCYHAELGRTAAKAPAEEQKQREYVSCARAPRLARAVRRLATPAARATYLAGWPARATGTPALLVSSAAGEAEAIVKGA